MKFTLKNLLHSKKTTCHTIIARTTINAVHIFTLRVTYT